MVILQRLAVATAALTTSLVVAAAETQDQAPLTTAELSSDYVCTHPAYKVRMVNKEPLVLYLEGFITADERAHLQNLAYGQFQPSTVTDGAGGTKLDAYRTSQSTTVSRDALVRCVEERALMMQGFDTPVQHLEPIQLVKYGPTQRYFFHTDWFDGAAYATASQGGNRMSSIFGIVKAQNVTGGGTNFPLLNAPRDERWCRFVDCDDEYDSGLTFRPVEGNAIYWENMLQPGKGDQRTLHAGLPLVSGEKIGINIWTRDSPLPPDLRGE